MLLKSCGHGLKMVKRPKMCQKRLPHPYFTTCCSTVEKQNTQTNLDHERRITVERNRKKKETCTEFWKIYMSDFDLREPIQFNSFSFYSAAHVYYRIRSNYRTNPYKRTVKKFRSLQITASVIFLYFFLKAYVVGTHLNCIDLSMQFK